MSPGGGSAFPQYETQSTLMVDQSASNTGILASEFGSDMVSEFHRRTFLQVAKVRFRHQRSLYRIGDRQNQRRRRRNRDRTSYRNLDRHRKQHQ